MRANVGGVRVFVSLLASIPLPSTPRHCWAAMVGGDSGSWDGPGSGVVNVLTIFLNMTCFSLDNVIRVLYVVCSGRRVRCHHLARVGGGEMISSSQEEKMREEEAEILATALCVRMTNLHYLVPTNSCSRQTVPAKRCQTSRRCNV